MLGGCQTDPGDATAERDDDPDDPRYWLPNSHGIDQYLVLHGRGSRSPSPGRAREETRRPIQRSRDLEGTHDVISSGNNRSKDRRRIDHSSRKHPAYHTPSPHSSDDFSAVIFSFIYLNSSCTILLILHLLPSSRRCSTTLMW